MARNIGYLKNQQGIALVLVLWVMVFLSIILVEFAFSVRTELSITRNFMYETQSYYLAQAGISKALTELLNTEIEAVYADEEGKLHLQARKPIEDETLEEETEETPPKRDEVNLGAGSYSYQIIDEEGKIDLNHLAGGGKNQRDVMRELFTKNAATSETDQNMIIDSIMDWVDKDDLHRANGVEGDYYNGLPKPYDCKNGPFSAVEELLLVKGITKEILFGSSGGEETQTEGGLNYPGIAQYLTVWTGGRFNKYSASEETLKIKYGEESLERIKESMYNEYGEPSKKHRSLTYSVISTGTAGKDGASRTIFAVIKIKKTKGNVPEAHFLFWNDNYIPYPG